MSTARLNNFNTLQYAEALKSAGVPDARAKAQAQALDRALWEAGFATYEGIKDFRRTSRKPPPRRIWPSLRWPPRRTSPAAEPRSKRCSIATYNLCSA